MHVLLVEHDRDMADGISHLLTRHGMDVGLVMSGREIEPKLRQQDSETVAIVDVALPDLDGFTVLRKLRNSGCTLPVMLLTSGSGVEQRVRGLELGADDCLGKPFAVPELVARLKALARRSSRTPIELQVGGLSLNVTAKRAWTNGQAIKLWPREWDILEYLMRNAARVVPKENIISVVSTLDDPITGTVVDVNISRIRQKIAGAGVTIRTLRGKGYLIES